MFILTDNKGKFICKDSFKQNGSVHERYSFTTDQSRASSWESREKAENIKNNCLNRSLRDSGFTVKEINKTAKKQVDCKHDEVDFTVDLTEILNDISHINSLMSDIPVKMNVLHHALSVVDREISDIHHWIEFDKFNAYQGYQAFAMLKEKLNHRRDIKNGIKVLDAVSNVETTVSNLKNRKYNPRELDELF